jgi:hypothetical protein
VWQSKRYRVTKRGALLILDINGAEVAVFTPGEWVAAYIEEAVQQ